VSNDDPFEPATINAWPVNARHGIEGGGWFKLRGGPVEAIQTRHPALQFS